MVRRRRALLVMAALTAPALACQLILGIDDHELTVPVKPVPDAQGAPDSLVPDPCVRKDPPPRPDIPGDKGDIRLVFAVHGLRATQTTVGGATVGFDLDRSCTCDERPAVDSRRTCLAPSGVDPAASCDFDAGIDNAGAAVFERLSGSLVDISAAFNEETDCGRQAVLLVVTRYNGEANDPDVRIQSVVSRGIREPHDGGERTDANRCLQNGETTFQTSGYYPAKYDPSDKWGLENGVVTGASIAGWVKDYQLVVDGRRDINPINIPLGATVVAINSPVGSARLVPLGSDNRELPIVDGKVVGTWATFALADGQLGGRAATRDMLSAIGSINIQAFISNYKYVCNSPFYAFAKSAVCEAVDTVSSPQRDFAGDPCDALSIGLQFEGAPASFVKSMEAVPPPATVCGQSPFSDSCGSSYEAGPTPCAAGDGGC